MLSESLRVPYRAGDAVGTILVGSVLTILSGMALIVWAVLLAVWLPAGLAFTLVVSVPGLVLRGYLVEVVDGGIQNEAVVPSFVQWGSLMRTGTTSTLISTLYVLPGAVLCGLAVGGVAVTVISPSGLTEAMQALTGILVLLSGVGFLLYGLVYLYVRPAARAVFAATGSLRAALQFRRIGRLAATNDYVSGWLITMGVLTVGPTVLLPLFVIVGAVGYLSPTVAVLLLLATAFLGIALVFVVRVSSAWATGRGAADGLGVLYPAATRADPATSARVIPNEQAVPKLDGGRTEADPAVQTGRTVEPSHAETASDTDTTESETDGDDSEFIWGLNEADSDSE